LQVSQDRQSSYREVQSIQEAIPTTYKGKKYHIR